jgi:conjugal transfer pilus assembly protein TrbC
MKTRLLSLMSAALLLESSIALAAGQGAAISDEDVARVVGTQPVITEGDIAKASQAARQPTEKELNAVPIPSRPRVEALPVPIGPKNVDLGAVASGYAQMQKEMGSPSIGAASPRMLIFVSFTMPTETLARLTDQAARSGATMVIRGLKGGSFKETLHVVHEMIGTRKVAFAIDPIAFERFAVSQVPTFALVRRGAVSGQCGDGQCYSTDAFVTTSGDVSLDYALEFIQRRAPAFSEDAGAILRKLRG